MAIRDWVAMASLAVCIAGGCTAPTGDEAAEEASVPDEPLDITVDSVDLVHGALRLQATMGDGAAEVSVLLGGDCERVAVGGGLSTMSSLVWTLGENELAAAIGCGLVVRARVREGGYDVNRIAELALAVDLVVTEDVAEDAPRLSSVSQSENGFVVRFTCVGGGARLTTGGSVLSIGAVEHTDEVADSDDAGSFAVPSIDFARSILRQQMFEIDGAHFPVSLSVGGTELTYDVDP